MKINKYTDQELLQLIKENSYFLEYVYKNTKSYSLGFMKKMTSKNNVSDEDLEDIFHDAVMVLYENIINNEFELKSKTSKTPSFQTYLNSVCRNQLLNKFKSNKKDMERNISIKKTQQENNQNYDDSITDTLEPIPDPKEQKFLILEKAMKDLKEVGGKCFELLTMFWYHKKSMSIIADHFGYSNAASAKNQKAKCQKRLKKIALKK